MVWLNNGMPQGVCEREPSLRDYGFYRRLNDGGYDFISFCDDRAKDWLAVHKDDFNRMMDALLPQR